MAASPAADDSASERELDSDFHSFSHSDKWRVPWQKILGRKIHSFFALDLFANWILFIISGFLRNCCAKMVPGVILSQATHWSAACGECS